MGSHSERGQTSQPKTSQKYNYTPVCTLYRKSPLQEPTSLQRTIRLVPKVSLLRGSTVHTSGKSGHAARNMHAYSGHMFTCKNRQSADQRVHSSDLFLKSFEYQLATLHTACNSIRAYAHMFETGHIQGFQAGSIRQMFSKLAASFTSSVTFDVPPSKSDKSGTMNTVLYKTCISHRYCIWLNV